MKIAEDHHTHVAEQGIVGETALKKNKKAKSNEFVKKGVEAYAKA